MDPTARIKIHGHAQMKPEERFEAMKRIIDSLHQGAPFLQAKAAFDEWARELEPEQIARMEQRFIREGLPAAEVTRLCGLHPGTFQKALDAGDAIGASAEHPIHTYLMDNEIIAGLVDLLRDLLASWPEDREAIGRTLVELSGIDNHFARAEVQLLPILERHGSVGLAQVIWDEHDEIRRQLEAALASVEADQAALAQRCAELARSVGEMIYKENKILFPLAIEKLSQAEWSESSEAVAEIGYALAKPDGRRPRQTEPHAPPPAVRSGQVALRTGRLPVAVLDAILCHLPLDLRFVDPEGVVRYSADKPDRVFPPSPDFIGRQVESDHPRRSVGDVEEILRAFAAGQQSRATFLIRLGDRFLYIQYLAVLDQDGAYLGCIEVIQDATAIRSLEAESRLVDWTPET